MAEKEGIVSYNYECSHVTAPHKKIKTKHCHCGVPDILGCENFLPNVTHVEPPDDKAITHYVDLSLPRQQDNKKDKTKHYYCGVPDIPGC